VIITPVVLCGGFGTRLWPLSRKSFHKQFVPLIGNKSLLQLTLERLTGLALNAEVAKASKHMVCVASENQSKYIPIGEVYRLKYPGKVYLEMIEVQSGRYLREDDIVRLEDTYGRTTAS
jgi:hypothetical protein